MKKNLLLDRLTLLISNLGIKKLDFAKEIHFSQSYVSMVLNGTKTNPSIRFIDAICREFNVNPEWLKDGKGDMYVISGVPAYSIDTEIVAKIRLLPPDGLKTARVICMLFPECRLIP